MKIKDIGEFGLIERLRRKAANSASVVKGIGDDCAVVEFSRKQYQLLTSDMLVEGVDFKSSEDPYLVGRKAMAASLSDIAACAGTPKYALVSLGLPKAFRVRSADRLYAGMAGIAKKFGVDIAGGDLSSSDKLVISVSLTGLVDKNRLVLRSGAREGDIILVSGPLGGSIRSRHLRFEPRIEEAGYLRRNFKINSMIDISDGLAQDLGHILKESRKAAVLLSGLIPIHRHARGLNDALYSGEDFELLFTMPLGHARRLLRKNRKFYPIGYIRKREPKNNILLVDDDMQLSSLAGDGYRHF